MNHVCVTLDDDRSINIYEDRLVFWFSRGSDFERETMQISKIFERLEAKFPSQCGECKAELRKSEGDGLCSDCIDKVEKKTPASLTN